MLAVEPGIAPQGKFPHAATASPGCGANCEGAPLALGNAPVKFQMQADSKKLTCKSMARLAPLIEFAPSLFCAADAGLAPA